MTTTTDSRSLLARLSQAHLRDNLAELLRKSEAINLKLLDLDETYDAAEDLAMESSFTLDPDENGDDEVIDDLGYVTLEDLVISAVQYQLLRKLLDNQFSDLTRQFATDLFGE